MNKTWTATAQWRACMLALKFFFATVLGGIMLTPFVWMFCTSLKPSSEVDSLHFWPEVIRWDNYAKVLNFMPDEFSKKLLDLDLWRWMFNSIFCASWITVLQVITSSMAAYAFSRISWRGRDKVFVLYLGTMMIPGIVLMIPQFQLMVSLDLVDTYAGLIIPMAFSSYGTFMLRQFMLGIPMSYNESAEIDGANHFQIYLDIILPLTKPGLITLAIFTFLGAYRELMWPLIMVKSSYLYNVSIGLLSFQGKIPQTELLMATTLICILPMVIIFICMQKTLVRGINIGGGVKE